MDVATLTRRAIRRKPGAGESSSQARKSQETSRQSTQTVVTRSSHSSELGLPIGRQGNDYPTPDIPGRGPFLENQDPGQRLQDFANTHLSEGPNPGRIARPWNARMHGKLGRNITGNPSGDTGFELGLIGERNEGVGDARYLQHQPIPRGSIVARAYHRTVDDAANVPAVYVGDPTRR